MYTGSRHYTVELNEHDIVTLINLVRREINDTERVWHPYWRQLLQKFQTGLEQPESCLSRQPRPANLKQKF